MGDNGECHMLAVLKYPQMRTSPLTLATRNAIDAQGFSFEEVAALLKPRPMNSGTLRSRLSKQNPLQLDSPKDLEIVRRIAEAIGLPTHQSIIDEAMRITRGDKSSGEVDLDMVDIAIETLRDGSASDERKDKAERAIRRMLGIDPEK